MNKYILGLFLLLAYSISLFASPTVKITLKVTDENATPIEGASAILRFNFLGEGLSSIVKIWPFMASISKPLTRL